MQLLYLNLPQMVCKIISALIVDTNINHSPCLILKLATIAIFKCLIQTVAQIEGLMIKKKTSERKPTWKSIPSQFWCCP